MTKKTFKELADYHNYCVGTGRGFHAFYYDYAVGENFRGYKWRFYCRKETSTKKELFDAIFDYINGNVTSLPYYIDVKEAETDLLRFKVSLGL